MEKNAGPLPELTEAQRLLNKLSEKANLLADKPDALNQRLQESQAQMALLEKRMEELSREMDRLNATISSATKSNVSVLNEVQKAADGLRGEALSFLGVSELAARRNRLNKLSLAVCVISVTLWAVFLLSSTGRWALAQIFK